MNNVSKARLVRANDYLVSITSGTLLPVFRGDVQGDDEPCDGYLWIRGWYDGRNRVEIQPVRQIGPRSLGLFRPHMTVGESYTMSERMLRNAIALAGRC